ncbi:hypothetical protein [Caulobacter soli]|uniref:hypothetical protein n=1 Tax=Caulobacter soli TaxID=2708539 RepID=UPI0013EAF342|nr:hypothetical protein [Caulobacter soli]
MANDDEASIAENRDEDDPGKSQVRASAPRPTRAERKARERAAFFTAHPRCCYCNGERVSEEIDHAPARICFRDKAGPEGFEFPACGECNRAAAASEQVSALHIRMFDHNGENLRKEDLYRLVEGVANNAPEAMPIVPIEAWERDAPPTASITAAAHRHLEVFATKILYAMYYRVTAGQMANHRLRRLVAWAQVGTPAAEDLSRMTEAWFGELRVGERGNVDIGDQFHFRHAYNSAHGYLGFSMSFGRSLLFFCVLGPAKQLATLKTPRSIDRRSRYWKPFRYQPIRELGIALKRRRA